MDFTAFTASVQDTTLPGTTTRSDGVGTSLALAMYPAREDPRREYPELETKTSGRPSNTQQRVSRIKHSSLPAPNEASARPGPTPVGGRTASEE
jgi:hypothetical protein